MAGRRRTASAPRGKRAAGASTADRPAPAAARGTKTAAPARQHAPRTSVAGHARTDVVAPAAPGRRRDPDLTARLVETLRNRILSQQDPPGSRLREPDLARQLGVSRSRLREALSVLEQRGLIVREANRGAVVRRMTLEDVVHTLDVREGLEGVCTRLATRNVPPESWQDLVDLFGKPVEAMLDRGDVAGYLGAHAKLQQRLLEAARNPVLTGILQLLYDQTRSVTRRLVFATDRARQGLVEHRAVLAAMRAGDAKAAERLRREHLRSVCEAAKRYHAFLI